jgi:hypothetical protein
MTKSPCNSKEQDGLVKKGTILAKLVFRRISARSIEIIVVF